MGYNGVVWRALELRILADRSSGERVPKWDPDTGEKKLYNPATGRCEPWPRLGVMLAETPRYVKIPANALERWLAEDVVSVLGSRGVVRPGGPPEDPWRIDSTKRIPHTFRHVDTIVFHTTPEVRYAVVVQPDKYHDGPPGEDRAGDLNARVFHDYLCELVP